MKIRLILTLSAMFMQFISFAGVPDIFYFKSAKGTETLAAKELQRYLYMRTGELPGLKILSNSTRLPGNSILVSSINNLDGTAAAGILTEKSLHEQEYILKSLAADRLLIVGGDETGVLYGVYKFLESTGIRFSLHNDIIPDKKADRINLSGFNKKYRPAFALRGIQPFHDFPEGPDWWNEDDYEAVITQLPKMGMNFIGFHNYPEAKGPAASKTEPLVWIGMQNQFNPDGTVRSAYPVLHFNTADTTWKYIPKNTSDFAYGASMLFEADVFGADYMKSSAPWPRTEQKNIDIFNTTGQLLHNSFNLAKSLGVKTCVGTEAPLSIPVRVEEHLKAQHQDPGSDSVRKEVYKGIFSRIKATYPLDYYWFWTPERWLKGDRPGVAEATIRDMNIAFEAAREINAPFTLATCGWVLGPSRDKTQFDRLLPKEMPMSMINRSVGFMPVEASFKSITGRPKWNISWVEDDGAMTTPQFWAGRILKDAADAYNYGCTGLMGIHWRTENLSPAFMALSRAGWEADRYKVLPDTQRDYPAEDLYEEWAKAEFGNEAGGKAAAIFNGLDGMRMWDAEEAEKNPFGVPRLKITNIHRSSIWTNGPGGIMVESAPWSEVKEKYAFVDDFEKLEPLISGAGAKERYLYWLNTFYYARSHGRIGCLMGEIAAAYKKIEDGSDMQAKQQIAGNIIILRRQATDEWGKMMTYLLQAVNTTGELGTIANLEQRSMAELTTMLTKNDKLLAGILVKPVEELKFSQAYQGDSRLVVTTKRTLLKPGEELNMKIRLLAAEEAQSATIHWKPLGEDRYKSMPLQHVARGVYGIHMVPSDFANDDFEYYVEVQASSARLRYPSGRNQTVVVW